MADSLQDRLRAAIDHFTSGGGGPRMSLLADAADRINALEGAEPCDCENPRACERRAANRCSFDRSASTLPDTLRNVITAAREVVDMLGGEPGDWALDGRVVTEPAATALLSLHDHLNDLEAQTQESRSVRCECDRGVDADLHWPECPMYETEDDRDRGTGAIGPELPLIPVPNSFASPGSGPREERRRYHDAMVAWVRLVCGQSTETQR